MIYGESTSEAPNTHKNHLWQVNIYLIKCSACSYKFNIPVNPRPIYNELWGIPLKKLNVILIGATIVEVEMALGFGRGEIFSVEVQVRSYVKIPTTKIVI